MIVHCAVYERGLRQDGDLALGEAFRRCQGNDEFVWLGIHQPTKDEFASVQREFQLHGAVLYEIVDWVVDDYMPALEGLREDVEQVESEVFSPERKSSARRIYALKREVLEFTRATAPLVDPIDRLAEGTL